MRLLQVGSSYSSFLLLGAKNSIRLSNKERLEVEPQFVGGQGPIRIDLDCRTTVEGLWAVGDASSLGSGYMGARASGTFGGFGIAFSIVSGFRGGWNAGQSAAESGEVRIDYNEVNRSKKKMLGPLNRVEDVDVNDVIYQIHEAVVPIRYNLHREGGRLKEALEKVDVAKQKLPKVMTKLWANKLYYLVCNDEKYSKLARTVLNSLFRTDIGRFFSRYFEACDELKIESVVDEEILDFLGF